MKAPDNTNDEKQRIDDLHSLDLLDSEREERFDRLTRLAKRLFDVPIAVVSLVDSNRQWFKSCVGLPVRETPRNVSFCGHAIHDDKPFIVCDASQDPKFMDNPLVTDEPYIRFYAGIPLVYNNDTKLGTLCIIDTEPRQFSEQQRKDLIDLAKLAEQQLDATIQATLDPVTQISNRRGFFELGAKSMSYCRMGGFSIALACFAIDVAKTTENGAENQTEEDYLRSFSDLLATSFGESDIFARISEDEFVVLMSGLTVKVADIAVARFRKAVEQFNRQQSVTIYFDAGVAAVKPSSGVTLDALLEMAQKSLQEGKYLNR
ncbi:GAF domain-containing protein [Vibrio ostreicida]|uniref:sensor domain-containing diguanylate cyclase n=1 Tax=Vibrio ostreicida TaxID=526588 RepID=UPI003B5CD837